MMLTQYNFGNSVCCQKVTMRAEGLAWEAIEVDLFKVEQYDPNYLKLNPKGVVPTLVHDGKPASSPPSSAKVARSDLRN
jgi:glutathione S-transferase